MNAGLRASFLKRFPGGPVLRVQGLRSGSGPSVTVLFGPSGAGKTTVLRCLAGLERPEEGRIEFGDQVWFDASRRAFLPPRRRNLGFVPQDYALFPHLTVEENVRYGLQGLAAQERRVRVEEMLRWLGLAGLARRRPADLSGGEQQRVALARAVVRRPRLLLLDEPFSAVDAPTRRRLRTSLRTWLLESGIPSFVVTHDHVEALTLGDQVVVVDAGGIVQTGPPCEVFNRPATLAVADIVGMETVMAGRVERVAAGLAVVRVAETTVVALAEGLPEGTSEVFVCVRAEDVILTREMPEQSSARNRLRVRVVSFVTEGALVRVELDAGFLLKALLTRQACAELALRPDEVLFALIKAPHFHLIPRDG